MLTNLVFEDKALADKAVHAVEKVVNDEDAFGMTMHVSEKAAPATVQEHIETVEVPARKA